MSTGAILRRIVQLHLLASPFGLAAGCARSSPPPAPPAVTAPATLPSPAASDPRVAGDPALAAAAAWASSAPPAEAAQEAAPADSLSGTIVLPRARHGDVHEGDTIFVVVRRAGGAPGPGSLLAAKRLQAGAFPLAFSVGAGDAMTSEGFHGPLSITVRVDKDGDPLTRRKGDVFGRLERVKPGARDLVVALDTLQARDEELEGRAALAGAQAPEPTSELPPDHPPLDQGDRRGLPAWHP